MKNKILVFFIILITLIILLMSGYFVYNKILTKEQKITINKQDNLEDDTIKMDDSKDYVYDADYPVSDEVASFQSLDMSEVTNQLLQGPQKIAVPYININTDDATKVNTELKALFDTQISELEQTLKTNQEHPDGPQGGIYLNYVTYETATHLSVIVMTGTYATSIPSTTYYGYVFDLKNGKLLASNDIAMLKGYTIEQLKEKTKTAINTYVNQQNNIEVFTNQLTKTYTDLDNSINNQGKTGTGIDGIIYFLDDNGNLKVLVNISEEVEAGQYAHLLDIE